MSRLGITLALLLVAGPVWADGPPAPKTPDPSTPAPGAKKDAEKKDEKEPEPDRWFAATGGTVHTVSGPVLPGVTVLAKNGRIVEVAADVTVPDGANSAPPGPMGHTPI